MGAGRIPNGARAAVDKVVGVLERIETLLTEIRDELRRRNP